MTEDEARRLQDDMKRELNTPPGAVLMCAVLLCLLIGIAWLGVNSKDSAGLDSPRQVSQTSAIADRNGRTVFIERRQRFIEAHPDSHVARYEAEKHRIQRDKSHRDESNFQNAGDYQELTALTK